MPMTASSLQCSEAVDGACVTRVHHLIVWSSYDDACHLTSAKSYVRAATKLRRRRGQNCPLKSESPLVRMVEWKGDFPQST
jgi:hypothetical protein